MGGRSLLCYAYACAFLLGGCTSLLAPGERLSTRRFQESLVWMGEQNWSQFDRRLESQFSKAWNRLFVTEFKTLVRERRLATAEAYAAAWRAFSKSSAAEALPDAIRCVSLLTRAAQPELQFDPGLPDADPWLDHGAPHEIPAPDKVGQCLTWIGDTSKDVPHDASTGPVFITLGVKDRIKDAVGSLNKAGAVPPLFIPQAAANVANAHTNGHSAKEYQNENLAAQSREFWEQCAVELEQALGGITFEKDAKAGDPAN